ncbi:MAG: hypothetical protein H6707_00120 [Deltaproteobacteria bacterium]|nr:hypothetical protein [Deltaproteobacteria bacterium]
MPASRKLGAAQAEALLKQADALIVAKGQRVDRFTVGEVALSELLPRLLGPTGNLRAPCLRITRGSQTTLLVGFDLVSYQELLVAR